MSGLLTALRDRRLVSSIYLLLCSALGISTLVAAFRRQSPLEAADYLLTSIGLDRAGAWLTGPLDAWLSGLEPVVSVVALIVLGVAHLTLFNQRTSEIIGSRLGATLSLVAALLAERSWSLLGWFVAGASTLVIAGFIRARGGEFDRWEPVWSLALALLVGVFYLPLLVLAWVVGTDNEITDAQRAAAITRAVLRAQREDEKLQASLPQFVATTASARVHPTRLRPGRQGASTHVGTSDTRPQGAPLW